MPAVERLGWCNGTARETRGAAARGSAFARPRGDRARVLARARAPPRPHRAQARGPALERALLGRARRADVPHRRARPLGVARDPEDLRRVAATRPAARATSGSTPSA